MPRPPNYSQERKERERAKANKKAEKLASRAAAREGTTKDADGRETLTEQSEDLSGRSG